jgi:transcriptional regulator with XRE-family HTH domain
MYTVNSRLPYNQEFDRRFIKYVRHSRNLTLERFSPYMGVDKSTIAKLEKGLLDFTPYYESKLREAIKRLQISNVELVAIRSIIESKERKGYK